MRPTFVSVLNAGASFDWRKQHERSGRSRHLYGSGALGSPRRSSASSCTHSLGTSHWYPEDHLSALAEHRPSHAGAIVRAAKLVIQPRQVLLVGRRNTAVSSHDRIVQLLDVEAAGPILRMGIVIGPRRRLRSASAIGW
jgi:hypothetical protein